MPDHNADARQIVVGVDGSPGSKTALRWAMTQARQTGATVEAVTTWRDPSMYGTAEQSLLVWLARTGLMRYVTRHQHLTNVVVSNVIGPTAQIRLLGAPVLDLIPIGALAGNLAISFLAFSYAGRLTVAVRADADLYPDLGQLIDAMADDWQTLSSLKPAEAMPTDIPDPVDVARGIVTRPTVSQ